MRYINISVQTHEGIIIIYGRPKIIAVGFLPLFAVDNSCDLKTFFYFL
jgi:hypothetical protein